MAAPAPGAVTSLLETSDRFDLTRGSRSRRAGASGLS
jgi:hypothetical protein